MEDFAITLSVLSKHKLNFGYTLDRKDKRLYNDLSVSEQDKYLGWLLTSSMRMTLDKDEIDCRLSYVFENHPNIMLKNAPCSKRHAHGVLYKLTVNQVRDYTKYLISYLKLNHSEKLQHVCIKIVPIHYHHGWITYMNKDECLEQMERDLKSLEEVEVSASKKIISYIDDI